LCDPHSFLYFSPFLHHRPLHSFPTRRSSDLSAHRAQNRHPDTVHHTSHRNDRSPYLAGGFSLIFILQTKRCHFIHTVGSTSSNEDRKSTRLNSSHVSISYAVFCLKKKSNNHD